MTPAEIDQALEDWRSVRREAQGLLTQRLDLVDQRLEDLSQHVDLLQSERESSELVERLRVPRLVSQLLSHEGQAVTQRGRIKRHLRSLVSRLRKEVATGS